MDKTYKAVETMPKDEYYKNKQNNKTVFVLGILFQAYGVKLLNVSR